MCVVSAALRGQPWRRRVNRGGRHSVEPRAARMPRPPTQTLRGVRACTQYSIYLSIYLSRVHDERENSDQ